MSITLAQSAKANYVSGTSITTGALATQATGSTFIIAVNYFPDNFTSVQDNKGNTYTQILTTADTFETLWYVENGVGGAGHTATLNLSAGITSGTIFFAEITGGLTVGILDKAARVDDSTSPFASGPTATTSQANELIFGNITGDSGSNPATLAISGATPSSGWVIAQKDEDGTTTNVGGIAWVVVSATGAYEASFTQSGSSHAIVYTATFKEAAAGGAAFDDTGYVPSPQSSPLIVSGW